MKKFILSLGLGFIVNNVVATLIAMFILNPLLNPMFNGTVRTEEAGLEMPALMGGYFLLTFCMVVGYNFFSLQAGWLRKGIVWGLLVGAIVFVCGHLIVAGWAITPPLPMFVSGLFDSLSTVATGIVIAYLHRNE